MPRSPLASRPSPPSADARWRSAIDAYARRYQMTYEQVEFETTGLDRDKTLHDLETFTNLRSWHPYIIQRNESRSKSIRSLQPPANIVKGLRVCGKCKGDSFIYYPMQLRSGDEGATIFWHCTKCKTVKKENS